MQLFLTCLAVLGATLGVRELPLVDLVRRSDAIAVVHVTRVERIVRPEAERRPVRLPGPLPNRVLGRIGEDVAIAEAQVVRLIKGQVGTSKLYFLAESTWTCDIAEARPGEDALLFLDDSKWTAAEGPGFLSNLATFTEGAPVFDIAHAGRGRMPLRKFKERDYAAYWDHDVVMPNELPNIEGPTPEWSLERFADEQALEARIGAYLKSQGAMLRISAKRGLLGKAWSCAVWQDNHFLWDRDDGMIPDERELNATQTAALWSVLEGDSFLSWPDASRDPEVRRWNHTLEVRANGEKRLIHLLDASKLSAPLGADMQAVLKIWLGLLEFVDSPDAHAAGAGYRELLSKQR